ncbi:hypothetical protein Dsin_008972 [Dipteronia sinensis]|uniref:RNase H type-1 domain-containing protein n=1 Tax=Dipteronia sinensis TaxID=43782 RepID=A0AAE0EBN1_9ROSI|nr:hypothetical protein Dsin_008972 [Dipteronia sinensis]
MLETRSMYVFQKAIFAPFLIASKSSRLPPMSSSTYKWMFFSTTRVSAIVDRLKMTTREWDEKVVKGYFLPKDVEIILGIPHVFLRWRSPYCGTSINQYRRNQVVHYKVGVGATEVCSWSESFIQDFRQALMKEEPRGIGDRVTPRWQALETGVLKINTDATLATKDGLSGLGVVIRDSNGYVMASACYSSRPIINPKLLRPLRYTNVSCLL